MKRTIFPLMIAVTSILAGTAYADIDTSDGDHIWGGGAEMNANISTGNTNIQSLGASAEVDYRPMPWTTSLKAGFMRNRTDDVVRARQINAALRTGVNITNNVDFFALGTYLQNRFRGIEREWLAAPGLGIYPVNNDMISIRVEGGAGFMNEVFFPEAVLGSRTFPVAIAGIGARLKISDVADLTNDLMWVDRLKETTDWRISNTAAIVSHMTSVLSLKVAYNTLYRHVAIPGYRKTDNLTTGAIVLKF